MLFTSVIFFVFLGVAFALWRLLPFAAAKRALCLCSLFFYGYWFPPYALLLLFSGLLNFYAARFIARRPEASRLTLVLALTSNLGLLGFFKYYNFGAQAVSQAAGLAGAPLDPVFMDILLPMGISFYTFQGLSYVIDVYWGNLVPKKRFSDFFAYLSFFPQLVAGPIVRATDFLPQLRQDRRLKPGDLTVAFYRVCRGLFLKVVIADNIARYVEYHFSVDPAQLSAPQAWLGAFMFAIQILCDFAGYSDVAIGIARLFGFRLKENFLNPYLARGFRDFWQRWHISLSSWFRDYLYIPLGGNQVTPMRGIFNLVVVFILCGLWHGAAWTFLIWGALHGGMILLERLLRSFTWARQLGAKGYMQPLLVLGTFLAVVAAWVPFRSLEMGHALAYWAAMFNPHSQLSLFVAQPAAIVIAIFLLVQGWMYFLERRNFERNQGGMYIEALIYLTLVILLPGPGEDFIYFQF